MYTLLKPFLLLIPFLFSFFSLIAQQKQVVIGTVTNKQTQTPVNKAHVVIENSTKGTSTDKDGSFLFKLKGNQFYQFYITHIGFHEELISVELSENSSDTVHINIELNPKVNQLKVVEIRSEKKPEKIYGSQAHHIEDFEFLGDDILLLTKYKTKKEAAEVLLKRDQEVIQRLYIPESGNKLYRDYLGQVFVIGNKRAYHIYKKKDLIQIQEVDHTQFETLIKPTVDSLGQDLVFHDFKWYLPEFNYYLFQREQNQDTVLAHIYDEHVRELFRSEYKYLSPAKKIQARKIAWKMGVESQDIAAFISGFHHHMYFEPPYAPAFVQNDSLLIFDHCKNRLSVYDTSWQLVSEIPFEYHLEKGMKWKKKILTDLNKPIYYGLFQRKGHFILKQINSKTGLINFSFVMEHRYVDNIRIKDNYVYYTYRPFESLQKKYLYREEIE